MHAQIRQATGRKQSACVTTCIEDKDGNIIMEQDNILARWHEYKSDLYDDNIGDIPQVHTKRELTPVTRRELEFALKEMSLKKAPGPDNIFTKILVASGEAGLTEITSLTNMMYQVGCFPEKKATAIPTCNITIHGPSLEQVNSFIYLGSMFTSDGRCVQDGRHKLV